MNLVLMYAKVLQRFEHFMAFVTSIRHTRTVAVNVRDKLIKILKRGSTTVFQAFVYLQAIKSSLKRNCSLSIKIYFHSTEKVDTHEYSNKWVITVRSRDVHVQFRIIMYSIIISNIFSESRIPNP